MSRLWSRFGMRTLAIGFLSVSLVGGVWLGTERQAQQRDAAVTRSNQSNLDDLKQLRIAASDYARRSAPQRAALADAQAKADAAAQAAAAQARAADQAAQQSQSSRSQNRTATPTNTTPAPTIPTSCNSYTGNKATGCALLLQWGFAVSQMGCLDNIWTRESGWNPKAKNSSSGAYGIPQASPASKMSVYGSDYLTNPVPQIKWGLDYIKNRYTSPCGAWSYWQAHGWY